MARVKLVLHGYLKDLYPEDFYIDAESPAEAINGFCKQTKAFDVPLNEEKHQIRVHNFDTEDMLYAPFPINTSELHLVPDVRGGKGGGFFKVVLGAVLIAAAVITGGTSLAALTAVGTLSGTLFSLGVSLVLGGLLELISPAPEMDTGAFGIDSQADPESSKYLGASQNTVKIGTRIPLLYGRHEAFGHYLSFNVDAKDVSV